MKASMWQVLGTGARASAVALALALVGVAPVLAQAQTGNAYGTIVDDQGAALPGVTVTLSGVGAAQVQVTDVQGQFRFLGLSPATYKLEAALDGFGTVVYEAVVVNLGRNTDLRVALQPAAIEETITVTAETPLLDTRKVQAGASVDQTELERIPTARDPWVILQTTPGVMVDRVNVGGNESGQQSNYVGTGDDGTNSTWSVDGVEITDIGAIGSSSSYFDFDAFEEMQVSTGGSDASARTGGVGMNLVTKRGTNEWRGSARYIVGDQDWQSDFNPDESDFGSTQTSFKQGNRIVSVEDYGAEFGGPILKDRLWIWASYGENQIDLLTVSDVPDATTLETKNGKLNWQVTESNSATLFYSKNDKIKIGRNAGPTRPPETTWNQGELNSKPDVLKFEDTHIFSSSLYLTAYYAEGNGGFQLVPQGGTSATQPNAALDENFIWHNTFLLYQSDRPQEQAKLDGSYFFTTGGLNHELKFGGNYRKGTVKSLSRWPGSGIDLNFYQSYGYTYNIVELFRDSQLDYEVEYTNFYVQDTLSAGNLTANVGLRYDIQGGNNLTSTARANPQAPEILPAATFQGGDIGFEWKTISPRLGLTYALGAEKKTLLRASYSRFAEQIGGNIAGWANPMYPGAYIYAYYNDLNGDGHSSANEIIPGFFKPGPTYNPDHPERPLISSAVDPDLDAPVNDELILGVEHALLPEFVLGFNFTYRVETDILEGERLVFDGDAQSSANLNSIGRVHTASDYVQTSTLTGFLPDGTAYAVPNYGLRPGVTTRDGTLLTNSDREREYLGASVTFNKRLSNRWMARGNFTWNDWTWNIPGSEKQDPIQFFGGGNNDGDRVLVCSGNGSGAKANVCISSAWSYALSGMYQIAPDAPWGFNVSAAVNGREGYSNPYFRRLGSRQGGIGVTLVTVTPEPDSFKNDDIHLLDLRIEKELQFDPVGVTLGVDCFNVFNSGEVLQRQNRLGLGTTDHVQEVVSPRIFRVGARLSFN